MATLETLRGGPGAPGPTLLAERLQPRWRLSPGAALLTLVTAVVAFLVAYPLLLLFLDSFQVGAFGTATHLGLDNWTAAFRSPKVLEALKNTFALSATRQAIALVLGIGLSWVLARTDLPARGWLEFGFWVAVFLPTLTVTLGWIMVFDSYNGLANQLWQAIFGGKGPFEIFSWWGIVWVHLMTGTTALKVMLLTPAFRNLDSSLEEAARASGASPFSTLYRVLVPMLAPTILVVLLLGTIRSLEAFEIELVLGVPANIQVYSTLIYRDVLSSPPEYGQATVLGMVTLGALVPFIAFQQWFSTRARYATVSGKFRNQPHRLGAWRWPLFGLVLLLVLIMTVLPVTLVIVGTFMHIFGLFAGSNVWTFQNWATVLGSHNFSNALRNSLVIAGSTAVLSMVGFSLLAYVIVRTRFYLRGVLDALVWMPSILPGIILSLGYLWLFLGTPFLRPLYGTTFVLVLVASLGSITLTTQVLKANLQQLGAELEEASAASGAPWWITFRYVTIPLLAPALAVVGVLAFSAAARATSYVALLSTQANQPLSMLQLSLMSDNNFEAASVVGVFILALTVGVAAIARVLGLSLGPEASR